MIPISLALEGFLSYRDRVEIDFQAFNLACISGDNGAGKSSILDGITWALFGRARKHDESVINLLSQRAEVDFQFSYEGNQYRVLRSNPRGDTKSLELYIRDGQGQGEFAWQPLTERTLRDTDQRIVDILRLDYESFTNASFLLQGAADQFTQQNPAARKKILSQILGLQVWDLYRTRASRRRRAEEKTRSQLDGRIAEITSELDQSEQRIKLLEELELKLARAQERRQEAEENAKSLQALAAALEEQASQVASSAEALKTRQDHIASLEKKISQRREEQSGHQEILSQAEEIHSQFRAWEEAQQALADWEQTAEKFRESENKRQAPLLQIEAERARLLQEKAALEEKFQTLQTSLEDLPGLRENELALSRKIDTAREELDQRQTAQEELERLHRQQAEARAENPRLYREMKDLEKRIQDLESAAGADCPVCGQPLPPDERQELISSLKTEGRDRGDRYRANQASLAETEQAVEALELRITQLSLAEDSLRTLGQERDRIQIQINALEEQQNAWQTSSQLKLDEIHTALKDESFAPEPRQALAALNKELRAIGYDAAEHDRIRKISGSGLQVQERRAELDRAEAALKPLSREISELEDQLEKERQALVKKQEEQDILQAALEKTRQDAPDLQGAQSKVLEAKEEEKVLQREVGAAQQKVEVLDQLQKRREELNDSRGKTSRAISRYRQLEEAFGKDGVPALLIEQALPNIETRANQILEKLSGGSMSIRFLTQREYKDTRREDLKETLDIQIRDQTGYRDYELFSGGESFRINFAIRLALSHVLAQRAGARLQTLVIDEGFGSQDSTGRQRLLEAIQLVQDDFEKILVITHVEQIKDAFEAQLLVEKTPQGSRVTLV